MTLGDLLRVLDPLAPRPSAGMDYSRPVAGLAYDSRRVEPGHVFFALPGSQADGHAFLAQAARAGALAAVGGSDAAAPLPYIRVEDPRRALGLAAHEFHRRPCDRLRLVGITGTSGKTTTTHAMEAVLAAAGLETGVIGTIAYRFADRSHPAPVTTPQSLDIAALLAEMAAAGAKAAVMEVSSHALDQRRVAGCRFAAAAFLNLSRDHLDYHADMEDYFAAKRRLFTEYDIDRLAAVNRDDPHGRRLAQELTAAGMSVLTFGMEGPADVRAEGTRVDGRGIKAELVGPFGRLRIDSPLLGRFNLLNMMAAAALGHLLGLPAEAIARGLNALAPVPGRLEDVGRPFGRRVLVDYSHKPEALRQALLACREFTAGRLTAVFGCGGERDRGKRPVMAKVAAELADLVVVTSDNPRGENPEAIIDEIVSGFGGTAARFFAPNGFAPAGRVHYTRVADRQAAVALAVGAAGPEDTVIICGKGHEDYQICGDTRRPFSDADEARRALQRLVGAGGTR